MDNLEFIDEEIIPLVHQDEDYNEYNTPNTSRIEKTSFIEPDATEATLTLQLKEIYRDQYRYTEIYRDQFHEEFSRENKVSAITNWGVMERPLKQVDIDPPLTHYKIMTLICENF